MANIGPNKGRSLRAALSRFAAMLIEEAQYVSGFSYAQLDEALGFSDGQSFRYSLYPQRAKTRAPQSGSIQQLENRVAAFLRRPAHKVVVENNLLLHGEAKDAWDYTDLTIGAPGDQLDLGTADANYFELGYEGDWPTFRRLITRSWRERPESLSSLVKRRASVDEWPEMMTFYAWQWGVLWDRGVPWLSRAHFGVPQDMPIDAWIAKRHAQEKRARMLCYELHRQLGASAGNLPEMMAYGQLIREIISDEISC